MRVGLSALAEAIKIAKIALDAAKIAFEKEAKMPENSKAEGQPLREAFESVMKENGLDFGEYNGRDMQGNACRDFLEKRFFMEWNLMSLACPRSTKVRRTTT